MKSIGITIKNLVRVSKRLDMFQGRIARRNARHVVLAALRCVREALDADYPAIRSEIRPKVSSDARVMERRLRKRGYVAVNGDHVPLKVALAVTAAGLKQRSAIGDWWLPSWAVEAALDCVKYQSLDAATVTIKKTKGRAGAIKALLAEIALRRDGGDE